MLSSSSSDSKSTFTGSSVNVTRRIFGFRIFFLFSPHELILNENKSRNMFILFTGYKHNSDKPSCGLRERVLAWHQLSSANFTARHQWLISQFMVKFSLISLCSSHYVDIEICRNDPLWPFVNTLAKSKVDLF